MSDHRCDVPLCDGTRFGHDLAVEFPNELAALDAALDRLRSPEDYVKPKNLAPTPLAAHTDPTEGA